MDSKQSRPKKVLMLPWLAHGHITPFLELAKKLSTKNFNIYLCSTPINLTSVQHRITETQSLSIKLVPLHLPPLSELPPHHHTTNSLQPHLLPTLKNVFDLGSAEFCKIVQTLSPDLVIYDFLQPWAPTVALEFNIPAVEFVTTGAAAVICYLSFLTKPNVELPFPELQLILQCFHPFRNAQPKMAPVDDGGGDRTRILESLKKSRKMILFNTFKELEGKYLDYLPLLLDKKIVSVGPVVQEIDDQNKDSEILQWLNTKDELSTVFVSFGSENFLSKEEREELAHGWSLVVLISYGLLGFPWVRDLKLKKHSLWNFLTGLEREDWSWMVGLHRPKF